MNGFCSVPMALVIIGAALFLALDSVAAKVDLSCGQFLSHECGEAIAKRVKWEKGSAALSDSCCFDLVSMGKPCHDLFIKAYKESGHFKGRTYSPLKRGDLVFNHCSDVIDFMYPAAEGPFPDYS